MKWIRSSDRLPAASDMYRTADGHAYFILVADEEQDAPGTRRPGRIRQPGWIALIQGETPDEVIEQVRGEPDDPGGYWWSSIDQPPAGDPDRQP